MTSRHRRLGAAAAAALSLGALAVPGVVLANPTSGLDMAAILLDQPKGQPWAVDLNLGAHFGSTDGGVPPVVSKMSFKFPHAQVNASSFPTCTMKILTARGPSGCPRGSLIGQGRAKVNAIGTEVGATILAFNGPGTNRNRQELIDAKADPGIDVELKFAGTLRKLNGGQYGFQLDITVPPIQVLPGQPHAAIESFSVSVGARTKKHGKKISYIDAPTVCPKAGLPFLGTFGFEDGSTSTSSATISCTLKAV